MRTDAEANLISLGRDVEAGRKVTIDLLARVFRAALRDHAKAHAQTDQAFAANRLIEAIDGFTAR